jgi:hypothetical protein
LRIWILVAITVLSLAYSAWLAHAEPAAAFYLVQSRAWELLVGTLLALGIVPAIKKVWQAEFLAVGGLLLIFASVELISVATPFPGLAALGPCMGAAAIIHSGATLTTWIGRILGSLPFRFVGLVSYSLYLWHWPVIVFYRLAREPTNKEKLLLVTLCIVLATISWRFVERPFRQRPFRLSTYGVLAVGAGLMATTSAIALIIGPASAVFWNLPAHVTNLLAYEAMMHSPPRGRLGCSIGEKNDNFNRYKKEDCLALARDRPNILLIGESHAEHLSPGLKAVYPNVNFLEGYSTGCKPVVGATGPLRCTTLIKYIFEEFLPHTHLEGIILAARWNLEDLRSVKTTTEVLRPFADKIFVFGPIVEYERPLPRILILGYGSNESELATGASGNRSHLAERDSSVYLTLSSNLRSAVCPLGNGGGAAPVGLRASYPKRIDLRSFPARRIPFP